MKTPNCPHGPVMVSLTMCQTTKVFWHPLSRFFFVNLSHAFTSHASVTHFKIDCSFHSVCLLCILFSWLTAMFLSLPWNQLNPKRHTTVFTTHEGKIKFWIRCLHALHSAVRKNASDLRCVQQIQLFCNQWTCIKGSAPLLLYFLLKQSFF